MSIFLPLGKIKETLAKLRPTLVCVLGIPLLTVACATEPSNQTTSTNTATNALASNDNSDNNIATNESDVICRYESVTGTLIKQSICYTKKNWNTIDNRDNKSAEELTRTLQDNSALPSDADISQGITNTATQPGF